MQPRKIFTDVKVYYGAMVLNVIIRFAFIAYVPLPTNHTRTRSFFIALSEMLRRWIWNFCESSVQH
jgi:hypothetical protein